MYLINVTMLELVILQMEFAVTQERLMEQPVMMETLAHNKTLVYLEHALDLIQSFVLPWINVTLLERAIHLQESAAIPLKTMELIVMTLIHVL